jgi:hypothetical protein
MLKGTFHFTGGIWMSIGTDHHQSLGVKYTSLGPFRVIPQVKERLDIRNLYLFTLLSTE